MSQTRESSPEQQPFRAESETKYSEEMAVDTETHSGKTEEAFLLEELGPFFEIEKKHLQVRGQHTPEALELREQMIQYQDVLAHYIIAQGNDREALKSFWQRAEAIAEKSRAGGTFGSMRNGVLTQVAAYKIFEKIERQPRRPHPKEDLNLKVDLWIDQDTPIQIKGRTSGAPKVLALEDSKVRKPGVSRLLMKHLRKFKRNITRDQPINDEGELQAFLLALPRQTFDPVTGEPSQEAIEYVKEYFDQKAA